MSKFWNLVWRQRGDTYKTIIAAILIAVGIRTFLFEPFNIPSGSMKPTLKIGDYLFVSKYSYGYSRYSFPWSLAPIDGRILASEPERGDVIVFKTPSDNKTDFIKRLIGLPGDKIQMKNGQLYINDQAVERTLLREEPDECRSENGISRSCSCGGNPLKVYLETLPEGRQHEIWECRDDKPYADNTPVFEVPAGHYFMMGDNRDNSSDSRFIGPVPEENLIGRAEILFFSHKDGSETGNEDIAEIWEVWKWPDAIRWNRFFKSID